MLKNVQDITNQGKQTGLNTQDNILALEKSQSPDMMDVIVRFDGSIEKRFGSNTQNAVIIADSAAAGFSPAGTLTGSLQAFWRLNEPSGTRYDSWSSHTLSNINSVGADGGILDKAALFVSANTQFLMIANTNTLAGSSNFAISSWIRLNSTSNTVQQTIVSKRDFTKNSDTVFLMHCDTDLSDSSLNAYSVTSAGNVSLDTANAMFGAAAARFDGTGDFILTGSIASLSTTDFTVEFFLKLNTHTSEKCLFTRGAVNEFQWNWHIYDGGRFDIWVGGVTQSSIYAINTSDYIHLAMTRSQGIVRLFAAGNQVNTNLSAAGSIAQDVFLIGALNASQQSVDGWIDEFRISNTSKYNANFTPPAAAFINPSNPAEYEYWLFVNTDNIATFKLSSSGTAENITVSASSFGALGTATWYNVVAYHDSAGGLAAVGVNLSMNSSAYTSGVRAGSAPFVIGAISDGSTQFINGRIDETGFWKKILTTTDRADIYNAGSANTYQTAFDTKPWASFNFGASAIRWLMVSAGTGVYASSNLGLTWVTVASDRIANYQYFERSKNVLIATSDSYDTPLAWSGSANTFMTVVNSNAPLCRYSVNFQGFLVLLNSNIRKRGFFYQDENTQLTGTWASSFDIPSSQDDEITVSFILRRYLYISTRYYLYRISYVGGNPDFSYLKVKDWGYIPRTVKEFYVEGVGQVVAGLCWDGKGRLFDGSDDQIFTDNVEQDNKLCDFSLDKLSFSGSGPIISFAEIDFNENVYKLVVAIGADSTQTTHMINYDGRSKTFYPFQRQHFNTMVMAESANRKFLMAFDRSGYCHMLGSGNLDGNTTVINEHYASNLIYEKSPAQIQKGHQTHYFFSNESCGRLYIQDRIDFDNAYKLRESFIISGSDQKFHIHKVIDIPETYSTYQWQISSSSGTSDPWKLQRYDHMMKGLGIGAPHET